jgi:hypothetical protein
VIKGLDNRMQAKLLESIQKAVNDLTKDFMDIIANIWTLLKSLELKVINDTKACISVEDQVLGRLIQRTMQDAETLNCASEQFFTLVNDVCQSVDLARKVPIIPSYRNKVKIGHIASEKVLGPQSLCQSMDSTYSKERKKGKDNNMDR